MDVATPLSSRKRLKRRCVFRRFINESPAVEWHGIRRGKRRNDLENDELRPTWALQHSVTGANLYCICCSPSDSLRAIAAGANDTYTYTTDGGTTWNAFHAEDNNNNITENITWHGAACYVGSLGDQVFLCGDSGYIVTATMPVAITPPQLSINIQYPPSGSHGYPALYGIAFYTNYQSVPGSGTGIAVGANSDILLTNNSGSTWNSESTPLPPVQSGATLQLNAISVNNIGNTTDGWAVGFDNLKTGYLWYTSDQGTHWTAQANGFSADVVDAISCAGGTRPQVYGWTVANTGQVLSTQTNGTQWTQDDNAQDNSLSYFNNGTPLYGVSWPNVNEGCIVGANGKIFTDGPDSFEKWTERDGGVSTRCCGT